MTGRLDAGGFHRVTITGLDKPCAPCSNDLTVILTPTIVNPPSGAEPSVSQPPAVAGGSSAVSEPILAAPLPKAPRKPKNHGTGFGKPKIEVRPSLEAVAARLGLDEPLPAPDLRTALRIDYLCDGPSGCGFTVCATSDLGRKTKNRVKAMVLDCPKCHRQKSCVFLDFADPSLVAEWIWTDPIGDRKNVKLERIP